MQLVQDLNAEEDAKVMFQTEAMMAKIYAGVEADQEIMPRSFNSRNSHTSVINNSRFNKGECTH